MKEFGASPYGGDLSKWPSRMVDAFVILQDEHSRVEMLRNVQEKQPRQQQPQQRQRR